MVRGANWVGDALLTTPALASLRRSFPQAYIVLLIRPELNGLFIANPHIDEVIPYRKEGYHQGLLGMWRLAQELKRHQFDLAFLLQNAFEAAWIAFLAEIPHRWGYAVQGRGLLLTARVHPDQKIRHSHQVDYYLGLVQALGLEFAERRLVLEIPREAEEAAERLLQAEGLDTGDALVGLNPGSSYGPAKRWMPEGFATLANQLARDGHRRVVIFGSRRDISGAAQVASLIQVGAVNLAGRTSLEVLAALLKRCRALVTNDTGAMHVAAAMGTPVVALFGPTDPQTTGPLGEGHQIIYHPIACSPCLLRECPTDHECMKAISVEEVLAAVEKVLNRPQTSDFRLQTPDPRPQTNRPAVFLDRDGTINEEMGYLGHPEQVKLIPNVAAALKTLKEKGFLLIVISNQSGVARGYFSEAAVEAVNKRLMELLREEGVTLDGVYYCPHHPFYGDRMDCDCRKPKPGLVERAAVELPLDLDRSYVVGDHGVDIELARKLGLRSALVLTGHGQGEWERTRIQGGPDPDYVAQDLYSAAQWILRDLRQRGRDSGSF